MTDDRTVTMTDRDFVTGAKAETQQRDWNRLREAIRAHDPEATEAAWEKCERWVVNIPTLTHSKPHAT